MCPSNFSEGILVSLKYRFGHDAILQRGLVAQQASSNNSFCLVGENETVSCFRAHFEEQLKNYKKQVSAT